MIKTRSKFNVSKNKDDRLFDGIEFDSVLELRYYKDIIKPAVMNGEISCERQVKFVLQPSFKKDGKTVHSIDYIADFVVTKNGVQTVIDTKGMETPVSIIKKKMFWHTYPNVELQLVGYSKIDGGWLPLTEIKQGRKARKKIKEEKEKQNG